MCCCGTPTVNGEMGYKWQPNERPSIRPVDPPILREHEVLIYDLPGRCGIIDAHCHHYRIVKWLSSLYLAVKHGGGEERIRLSTTPTFTWMLTQLEDTTRYWLCHTLYHATAEAGRTSEEKEDGKWRTAAAEKRIKTQKIRNRGVKVWIEPKIIEQKGGSLCAMSLS